MLDMFTDAGLHSGWFMAVTQQDHGQQRAWMVTLENRIPIFFKGVMTFMTTNQFRLLFSWEIHINDPPDGR